MLCVEMYVFMLFEREVLAVVLCPVRMGIVSLHACTVRIGKVVNAGKFNSILMIVLGNWLIELFHYKCFF